MDKRLQDRLSGCLRQVVSSLELRTETDQNLLRRFTGQRDEAAFAAVVRRHGPMVLRVAFRALQNEHDAEDVFQATFLVLSQKAHALRRQESLASWLYGIAYRLALKSKATSGARGNREQRVRPMPAATPLAQLTVQEAQTILDEEISRLPEKLREPLVLCCLEGLARAEAAQQIGCPASVLKSRLEQARERLRHRLVARGLTLPSGLGAFLLLEGGLGATVPPALLGSTIKAASAVAAGEAASTVVTAKVAALTEGALRTMLLAKVQSATVALVGMLVLASIGALSWSAAPAPGFRGGHLPMGAAKGALPAKLVERWTVRTGGAIEGAVAVADGVVFAGSLDEHLYAVELATGTQRWKLKAGPIKAAPVVNKGVVYFSDLDGTFGAVDATRRNWLWKFQTGSEMSRATFFGGDVLFACRDEHLYCLSSKNGTQRWKFKTDGPSHGSPAVAEGKAFLVGCDSSLHVIDIATGKEERSVDLGGQTDATAAVLGDQLYVGTRNEVKAIDWKKGTVTWAFKPRRGQGGFGSAAVMDRLIVVGNRDNRVVAIDRANGTAVWSFPTDGRVESSPVIVGSKVVVGSLDGKLYVLDLATGRQLQQVALDGPIVASPVVVNGQVLIGTQKGTLYCLGEQK